MKQRPQLAWSGEEQRPHPVQEGPLQLSGCSRASQMHVLPSAQSA